MASRASASIVPRISLIPAVSTWAPLFAAYHAYLSLGAASGRVNSKTYLANSTDEASPQLAANRAHGNFTENVPIALMLATIAELNGANTKMLNAILGFLFFARVAHAEFGVKMANHAKQLSEKGYQWGRLTGFLGSNAVIVGLGAYAFNLALPTIKAIYA